MKDSDINTRLIEIKLLEIAVRASGRNTRTSANFVKELGLGEIVQKIKDEHPDLARALTGARHSSDWIAGFQQACSLVVILGELVHTMLERSSGDESQGPDFTVREWTRELSACARRLVPDLSSPRLKLEIKTPEDADKVDA